MQQKNTFIAKIFGILFIMVLIPAVILHFFPSKGNIEWLTIENAIKESQNSKKMILLNITSENSPRDNIANKVLFSNDTICEYLNKEFILAKTSLNTPEMLYWGKEFLKLSEIPTYLILMQNGKELTRSGTVDNSEYFYYWLKDTSYKVLANLPDYKTAVKLASENTKYLMALINKDPSSYDVVLNVLKSSSFSEFSKQNLVVVSLISSYPNEVKLIEQLEASGTIKTDGEHINSSEEDKIVIIFSPDGKELSRFYLTWDLGYNTEKLIDKIKKVISQ